MARGPWTSAKRARAASAILGGLASSCSHPAARDPLAFARPGSFEARCAGDDVLVTADSTTMERADEVMRSRSGWTVTTAGGTQHFRGIDEALELRDDAPLGPFCQRAREANRAKAAREMDGTCILAINHGEWGGWIETVAPGPPPTRVAIAPGLPKWLFRAGGDGHSLAVLGGGGPMGVGVFSRLERAEDGAWCMGRRVELGGDPEGWRADGPGTFAVLVLGSPPSSDDGITEAVRIERARSAPGWYFVVRIDDEGHLLPAPHHSPAL